MLDEKDLPKLWQEALATAREKVGNISAQEENQLLKDFAYILALYPEGDEIAITVQASINKIIHRK